MPDSEPRSERPDQLQDRNGAGLHIVMLSLHGLIRGSEPELGFDADTGGQIRYVIELAGAVAEQENIERVELITRRIDDPTLSDDYAKPFERLSQRAAIVRLAAGGDDYIRKEKLWPHLDEFVKVVLDYYEHQGVKPDIVHGHYADAGYVAARLAEQWQVPLIFTGHSLGRNKRRVLRSDGMSGDEIEEQYKIGRRIAVEEEVLERADIVVASTKQEVVKGYELYNAAAKANFQVIAPGIDVERFYPYYYDLDEGFEPEEEIVKARVRMRREIARFLQDPDKPLILAISRPDRRKNIEGLVRAYGEDKELRHIANLAVFAGVRGDIEEMDQNEREVLTGMLLAMDRYDLYGRLALPKKHRPQSDIPALYRLVAAHHGVFVNTALVENFGITLLEASSSGLPVVSTDHGGPAEIINTCGSGELIDARDTGQIQSALKGILVDRERWERYSENGIEGVREHYSWTAHARKYLTAIAKLLPAEQLSSPAPVSPAS